MSSRYVISIFLLGAIFCENADSATLDIGGSSACAIHEGGVQCWGKNDYGQLGNGTTEHSALPKWVSTLGKETGVTDISVGYYSACALASGNVYCWGLSGYTSVTTPVPDSALPVLVIESGPAGEVQSISTGVHHGCAVIDGGASCWGEGYAGQLGNGAVESETPLPVFGLAPGSGAGVTQIAASDNFTCAVVDGGVQCWGSGEDGRLGNGSESDSAVPVDVIGLEPGMSNPSVKAVAVTNSSACALLTNTKVKCWGQNLYGKLGDGSHSNSATPVSVLISGTQTELNFVEQIDGGADHVCATLVSGTVVCWGKGEYGQLGNKGIYSEDKAKLVQDVGGQVSEIHASEDTTCARLSDNSIKCWGINQWGNLGLGSYGIAPLPQTVAVVGASQETISGSWRHSCARVSGGARCWGSNRNMTLGNGDESAQDHLTAGWVTGFGDNTGVLEVSTGTGSHSCLLASGGAVWCWGSNYFGQLGSGAGSSAVPVSVAGQFGQIELGAFHSCGRTVAGQVQCWGSGWDGKLGNASIVGSDTPVTVVGANGLSALAGVTIIEAGEQHSCAISNGALFCWGSNFRGELGYPTPGENKYSSVAKQVVGLPAMSVTRIAAGNGHTCAGMFDGSTWCWGFNLAGETGTGSGGVTPHKVELGSISQIAAGEHHTCARVAGAAYCWGSNEFGQIGDGTLTDRYQPVKVATPAGAIVTSISAGSEHTCATFNDGQKACWGNGLNGRLGNLSLGYVPYPSSPVLFAEIFRNGFENPNE